MNAKVDLHLGDCITGMQGKLTKESVHLIVTSVPFEELFTYSGKPEDVGNNGSTIDIRGGRFALNMRFVVGGMFRVLAPGCNATIHIQQLLAYRCQHGFMGRRDFRGAMIDVFGAGGFNFTGEFVIPKNPQAMAQRLNLHSLQFMTGYKRNGCLLAPAVNDYVLIFQKPGEHPCPPKPLRHASNPTGWVTTEEWIRDASGVWDTISEIDVLDGARGHKEEEHEKHVCLAKGSLVLTRDGYRPIETIAIGDLVLTHQGRWRPITAKACNGVRPIVRVTAQGVADLRLTPNHELWLRGAIGSHPRGAAKKAEPKWAPASASKESYINLKLPPIEPSAYSTAEWWLVGRWLADGHFDARGRVHISCGKNKLEALIAGMGGRAGAVTKRRSGYQVAVNDRDKRIRSILGRCGRLCAGKMLPAEALALDQEHSEALLSGYLSGDGHYAAKYSRWTASSVSRPLLLGMAMLAQRARGVIASVYAGRPEGMCTIEGRTMRSMQDWILSIPPRNLSGLMLDDGAWKKVRQVQPCGEAEVWDLRVEEDESFTAEGCIVHNCPLQLEVIRRLVRLYTNPISVQPDVLVCDPFMGIGSTAYVCAGGTSRVTGLRLEEPRNVVGFELKESYWKASLDYVAAAQRAAEEARAGDLFAGGGR